MDAAKQSAKALYAGLAAFLGALATVMVGDVGFGEVTDGQWVASIVVGLGVAGGVWGIPNKPVDA
jgi:hypothetical protein